MTELSQEFWDGLDDRVYDLANDYDEIRIVLIGEESGRLTIAELQKQAIDRDLDCMALLKERDEARAEAAKLRNVLWQLQGQEGVAWSAETMKAVDATLVDPSQKPIPEECIGCPHRSPCVGEGWRDCRRVAELP